MKGHFSWVLVKSNKALGERMSEINISADFPFESKFVSVNGSKIHYVEAGEGEPILFVHGNPTSSYIWRNIMPYMQKQGRAIAVDLIGFGKSDKPDIDYGFKDSYEYLEGFINELGLENITLVVQDWGSGLGFHYANLHRKNIKAIAFMEAMYRPVVWEAMSFSDKLAMKTIQSTFMSWMMLGLGNQFVTYMLPKWVERVLSPEEVHHYSAPFQQVRHRKPIWVFPRDVPVNGKPEHTAMAVQGYFEWLQQTEIPKLCLYAEPGLLIREKDARWIEQHFPNTTMVPLGKGTHYVQEDYPHKIGKALSHWYQRLSASDYFQLRSRA